MSWLVASLLLFLSVSFAQESETRIEIKTPPTLNAASLALSPDGSRIVFPVTTGGKTMLWLYSVDLGTSQPLPGTDDVEYQAATCWSPDGRFLAYFGRNILKVMDIESKGTRSILGTTLGSGCSWNTEGTILFGKSDMRVIYRTTSRGGTPVEVTPPSPVITRLPSFLPDGRHFLYLAMGDGIYAGDLEGGTPKKITESDSSPVYASTGHLLFVRGQTLYAQRFDADKLAVSGDPLVVAKPVTLDLFQAPVSASANGHLIFRAGIGGGEHRQFTWFDRKGKPVSTVASAVTLAGSPPFLSADGKLLAIDRALNGNTDVWTMDVSTGSLTKLTEPPGIHVYPMFSPDNKTVYFASNKTGRFELYERLLAGDGDEKLVLARASSRLPRDISRDGRFILFRDGANVSAVQLDAKPRIQFPVIQPERGSAEWPQFSPDGQWVVYHLNEGTGLQVYMQPFPNGDRVQVSKNGGLWPRWSGNEIFYVAPDNQLMAVTVDVGPDPLRARVGEPVALFSLPTVVTVSNSLVGPSYIVSADNQRFLIPAPIEVTSPITLVKNWKAQP